MRHVQRAISFGERKNTLVLQINIHAFFLCTIIKILQIYFGGKKLDAVK